MKKNEVKTHSVDTWSDYLQIINDTAVRPHTQKSDLITGYTFSKGSIFRGQANEEWTLCSKLERNLVFKYKSADGNEWIDTNLKTLNPPEWYEDICKQILERFRGNLSQIPNQHNQSYDDNETWAFGRHFGLLTPFLDWTYNPYVATFFAFHDAYNLFEIKSIIPGLSEDKRVVVWKLNLWGDTFKENDFEMININAKIDSRINAQQGLFTTLKNNQYYDIESYLKSRGIADHLEKIVIPYDLVFEALKFLDVMGINIFRLFPDYEGAAKQANIQTESIHQQHLLRTFFPIRNANGGSTR